MQGQQILITLDNFEQLLDAAPILSELLSGTQVTFLITSRETLNLQEEWLYPLGGMRFPVETAAFAEWENFGAIQLFTDRAKRVRPDFSLEQNAQSVAQICRMVEGMPLALELSAPWIKSLSCSEIASEIARNRDFLATRMRNVPERHRSLQAIFAQTWHDLDEQEQDVFQRLSIFRGGFLRDAAAFIAGANLPRLSALLDKSLLRWETDDSGNGRYQIHELLRQYAHEKLLIDGGIVEETTAKHAQYYTKFLDDRLNDLLGGRQLDAMLEIESELNNIRAAWQWAIDHQQPKMLFQMGMPLVSFFWYSSRFHEAADAFEAAVDCVEFCPGSHENKLILAAMLTNHAWFITVKYNYDHAIDLVTRSLNLYEQLDEPFVLGLDTDPRLITGIIFRHSNRVPQAIIQLKAALQEVKHRPNKINEQCAHRLLAQTYHSINELELAEKHARPACDLADELDDLWGAAYNHDTLGRIALAKGDYETAERELIYGYKLQAQLQFSQGLADICLQLADLYLLQNRPVLAKQYAVEGLTLYQESKTTYGIMAMQAREAQACLLTSDLESARVNLLAGVQNGLELEESYPDILLYIITVATDLGLRRKMLPMALNWLAYAKEHPLLWPIHHQYALNLFNQHQDVPSWELALEVAQTLSLSTVLTEIQAVFLAPLSMSETEEITTQMDTAVTANQSLVDPLTNRELEVLQLIAEGLSNRQIADELIISPGTVKYYTSQIYSKLQVSSRTQAVGHARKLGILNP